MSDKFQRLRDYIERRKRARGIHLESIHGFDAGGDDEVELRLSDLEALLAEVDALRKENADLRKSSQAVVDRWDSPQWKWTKQGPTADVINDLRTALRAKEERRG